MWIGGFTQSEQRLLQPTSFGSLRGNNTPFVFNTDKQLGALSPEVINGKVRMIKCNYSSQILAIPTYR